MSTLPPYSVCMAVYKNDNAEHFHTAVQSMLQQTVAPAELILVIDGPIGTALETEVHTLQIAHNSLQIIRFSENRGLAAGRQAALLATANEIVAFMDSDDIACPDRMQKQLEYLSLHPDTALVGGNIEEFIGSPEHIVGRRIVPAEHAAIMQYMKARCPMNMMTVTARKSALLQVGGFKDWHYNEDFYLWIRLSLGGYVFANLSDTLVYVRVGEEMYQRRGGWKYFKSERGIQHLLLQSGIISLPRYCYNVCGRFAIQVLMPNKLRGFVFRKVFRD